ncbi:MAG: ComF family protein [Sphaerochaetaceae bacterium]
MWCQVCKKISDTKLCSVCEKRIREAGYGYLYKQTCPVCGNPILDRIYACSFCTDTFLAYGPYGKTLATLLRRYKIEGEISLIPLLADIYKPLLDSFHDPLLIPIPCSREGYRKRGFDQMVCLSSYLAHREGYVQLSLFSKRKGIPYKQLSKAARSQGEAIQLANVYSKQKRFRQLLTEGYTAILIDDVSTTGITCRQAKQLLHSQFGCEAYVIVLANS